MCFTKRVLIYTTFGYQNYFKVAGKLSNAVISCRTKSNSGSHFPGGHSFMSYSNANVQYDIYVKKEDEYKAQQAIYRS
ncbi:MAG: hypothetical protein U9N81_04530 [Bacillota bacterium]|nr:hypothetical protein [Bacillota bacterium]